MKSFKNLLRPIAYIIGKIITSDQKMFDIYRHTDFRGKLFLSEYINHAFQNGIYHCNELKYNIDFSDQIQKSVYLGTYERHEISFLKKYVKPGWLCLDIGANIGFYTLNLSKLVEAEGKVYAIEPSPSNYKKLEENIAINNLDNCITSNIALSSESGEFVFSVSPHQNSGWGRLGKWEFSQSQILVAVNTLDDFLSLNNISRIDFLKIDVEGHELEFFKGAINTLKNGIIRRIMIEYCGDALEPQGITLKDYVDSIMKFGYIPVHFNLDRIEKAKNGTYQSQKEILNLLFEKNI
ncbi:FkbM family methyltransferase [Dolichospermum sp. ST_con]|nr:FkbM family methyltransferase [Dolichospermum sp. ST_con]MDD1419074.1 FkbM family methyltransferase [Dolichospermum sp. ST_sed1]MDD1424257.1 FkbM family methyltransferase [Dolichospermum sp. ST_sed9]MDD1429745.1 FkbM family methyltransferase [Dolichospermum sp. ST_sed6]MDD1436898.1 FkbM family methyltransferase [Dolichospermum sp. ST_sed10]MDD1440543.1 FkbM family methyltransferase [Dolichospermum sp. ST_sed3]MDD1446099.1 FkbM family methyltransferase [Dolichospermum sp. ST_sed8]MDD145471